MGPRVLEICQPCPLNTPISPELLGLLGKRVLAFFISESLFSPRRGQGLHRGVARKYLLMKKFSKVLAPRP